VINAYTYPSGSFDEISIDIQQTSNFFVIMLALLRTKFLLPTFYVFSESFQKNVKSHVFLKSEKKTKNTYSRILSVGYFITSACVKEKLVMVEKNSTSPLFIQVTFLRCLLSLNTNSS